MIPGHLKSLTIGHRIGIIIVLTLFSIALHEFGHFIVYSLAGVPVHVSLQSVRPTGNVDASLDRIARITISIRPAGESRRITGTGGTTILTTTSPPRNTRVAATTELAGWDACK